MQGKRVTIVLDLEVLQEGNEVCEKVGSPVPIGADGTVANQEVDQSRAPNVPNNGDNKRGARYEPTGSLAPKRLSILDRPPMGQGNPAGQPVFPIASLTPYQNKWTIKARVTNKTSIKRWSNSSGDGHLFSMDLLDESGEIRATAFKAECDRFEHMVEIDKVYYISNCKLKPANKQYTSLNNDYELTFYEMSDMVPCNDQDTNSIPRVTFNFVQLDQLKAEHKDQIVDVIAVCRSANELSTGNSSRTGKEYTKRDLKIVDKSMIELRLTIWGEQAKTFNADGNKVIAVKSCKVSDFGGVSLSTLQSSIIRINPDIPKGHELKGWYENVGYNATFQTVSQEGISGAGVGSNFMTIGEVKSSQIGMSNEKGDYYSTLATTVQFQKDRALYTACTQTGYDGKGCNKKVQDQGNGTYRCEKCNVDMDNFNWRLIMRFSIADATDNQWVQTFHDQAEQILGISAQELGTMQTNDPEGYNRVFDNATFKMFNFRLRANPDNYNDEVKVRHSVVGAEQVNFDNYKKMMTKELKENGVELPSGLDDDY